MYDLKARLQGVGSDLSVWAGQSHIVIPRIVEALQKRGDHVHGVWMSKEPHTEEVVQENRIRKALQPTQTAVKTFEHRSLIHPQDLPFPVAELPDIFTQFRKRVEGPDMYRDPLPAPRKLKPFAEEPDIEARPGLYHVKQSKDDLLEALMAPLRAEQGPLAIPPSSADLDVGKTSAMPFKGGETEALERLEHYFSGGKNAPAAHYKDTRCVTLWQAEVLHIGIHSHALHHTNSNC